VNILPVSVAVVDFPFVPVTATIRPLNQRDAKLDFAHHRHSGSARVRNVRLKGGTRGTQDDRDPRR
jgi:hypothetical protein